MPRAKKNPALDARVGARLRALREERERQQDQLAEEIGVEPETLSRAETGKQAMSLANLLRAAEALQVPLSALFEFDGAPLVLADHDPERDLLTRFRRLDEEHQRLLLRMATEFERAERERRR